MKSTPPGPADQTWPKQWNKLYFNCELPLYIPTEIRLYDTDMCARVTQQAQDNLEKMMDGWIDR